MSDKSLQIHEALEGARAAKARPFLVSDSAGQPLRIVQAESPLAALNAFAQAEGFGGEYHFEPRLEDSLQAYSLADGAGAGAPFTNFEIAAHPLEASLGPAGWGVANPFGGDALSDGYDSAAEAEEAASRVPCLCSWEDGGDGETGPRPHIAELSEHCPDPEHREAFREEEEHDRGLRISLVQRELDRGGPSGLIADADPELLEMLYRHAESALEQEPDFEEKIGQEHKTEAAAARVADAMTALYYGSQKEQQAAAEAAWEAGTEAGNR